MTGDNHEKTITRAAPVFVASGIITAGLRLDGQSDTYDAVMRRGMRDFMPKRRA